MSQRIRIAGLATLLLAALALGSGCDSLTAQSKTPKPPAVGQSDQQEPSGQDGQAGEAGQNGQAGESGQTGANGQAEKPSKPVAGQPGSVTVLVNKKVGLPSGFQPPNLVDDKELPFLSGEGGEKRLMAKETAEALKKMFADAKRDGIYLSVASAYRSNATQTQLFNYYVQTQGEAEARRYSAVPGHSEHETGLAVDVSGSDGKCAVEDCFADLPEAKWIADHVDQYGFIIRYPKGKESITGYAYEPWHLRYVGTELAADLRAKDLTMEEYFQID